MDFTIEDIRRTAKLLVPHVVSTPIHHWHSRRVAAEMGTDTEIVLKLELLQNTGSFKARGVISNMLRLTEDARRRGVTTISSGNHAVAVSYGAKAFGTSAKVVMYATASPVRKALAQEYGAELVITEPGPHGFALAEKIAADEGRTLIHPFEGQGVSLGTATCGLELFEQAGPLDAVVVAIGGGGLASGVAAATKLLNPNCKVYGVEPVGADTMYRSFQANSPQAIDKVSTIADSLAPPTTFPYVFGLCKETIDRIVLVDDDQICRAMAILFQDAKLAVEPSAAAALAGMLGPLRDELRGKKVGVIVCGANIDIEKFAIHIRRGLQ